MIFLVGFIVKCYYIQQKYQLKTPCVRSKFAKIMKYGTLACLNKEYSSVLVVGKLSIDRRNIGITERHNTYLKLLSVISSLEWQVFIQNTQKIVGTCIKLRKSVLYSQRVRCKSKDFVVNPKESIGKLPKKSLMLLLASHPVIYACLQHVYAYTYIYIYKYVYICI